MKTSGFPIVEASVRTQFEASHSLPGLGVAEPHSHVWQVRAGWRHEINPHMGCTKPMQSMQQDLQALVKKLEGADLSKKFGTLPATSETIACWIMAHLPAYWMFVEIEAYSGYRVRVQADALRAAWAARYQQIP